MTDYGRREKASLSSVSAAAAAAAFLFAAPSAFADNEDRKFNLSPDWYVSGFAATLVADENNILFDQFGWQGSLAAGRRLDDGRYRVELEATRRRIGLVGLNGAGEAPGQFNGMSGFLNGYVHFKPKGVVDPYLGAGFGRGRQNYNLRGMADGLDYEVIMDDYSESHVYHLMSGLEFDFTPRASWRVESRYFTLEDKTIGANFGRWNGIERSYQLGVGLSYSIGN
jgi:opacity protein-like surface antigen